MWSSIACSNKCWWRVQHSILPNLIEPFTYGGSSTYQTICTLLLQSHCFALIQGTSCHMDLSMWIEVLQNGLKGIRPWNEMKVFHKPYFWLAHNLNGHISCNHRGGIVALLSIMEWAVGSCTCVCAHMLACIHGYIMLEHLGASLIKFPVEMYQEHVYQIFEPHTIFNEIN